ncbi:MAG: gamma-glutamyltransferase [Mariprofundaceae bacterium]|nr:gamma-glutamyltransferase [Mariprofundaceae bacterium]
MKKLMFLLLLLLPMLSEAKPLTQSMVVSAHPLATKVGTDVLRQGGNAFDAAAATALALGVVEPGSSGIGGGGFFLLYIAKQDRYVMLDARETSPVLAGHGEVYAKQSSINGAQAAGVPGLLAGIERLSQHYGRLSRQNIALPAIHLARDGFPITKKLQRMIAWRAKVLNDAGKRIYLNQGQIPTVGWRLKQQALADTLQKFAHDGAHDFYHGETAGRLVADMKRDGGLIRRQDLAAYQVKERVPVTFDYHGYHFVSAALPSSGGITLAEIFTMLKDDDLSKLNKVQRTHLLVEAMKRAYNDRNTYLGDADFVPIPNVLNPQRLKALRASIDMTQATPSSQLKGFAEPIGASVDTTHFSIVDHEGNMVSATLSINYGMGSGYVSPSTGILLNDEMDDFATQAGKANAYGLIQGKANAVSPYKRMLSSMSPTFVVGKNRTFIVGTPGGSRIISMVMLASMNFIWHRGSPSQWVNAPRFHHQFLPDVIQYEQGAFSSSEIKALKKLGHHLKPMRHYGDMQAILWQKTTGKLTGMSDQRGEGK